MADFASIIDFLKNVGSLVTDLLLGIPDFLRPLALAFVCISAVYLIVGRN